MDIKDWDFPKWDNNEKFWEEKMCSHPQREEKASKRAQEMTKEKETKLYSKQIEMSFGLKLLWIFGNNFRYGIKWVYTGCDKTWWKWEIHGKTFKNLDLQSLFIMQTPIIGEVWLQRWRSSPVKGVMWWACSIGDGQWKWWGTESPYKDTRKFQSCEGVLW